MIWLPHCSTLLYQPLVLLMMTGMLEPIPAVICQEVGTTPDRSPVSYSHLWATFRVTSLTLDKPECLERTQADTRRTLHRNSPDQPVDFEAAALTTAPPCCSQSLYCHSKLSLVYHFDHVWTEWSVAFVVINGLLHSVETELLLQEQVIPVRPLMCSVNCASYTGKEWL